jgi:hypothetical protein
VFEVARLDSKEATMEKKDRAARTKPVSEPPAREMKLNPDSVKDLAPSVRTGFNVKGGIPRLNGSGGTGGTGGG